MNNDIPDEARDEITVDEAAYAKLKYVIQKTINDFTNIDAVDVDFSNNEKIRVIKSKMIHTLQFWQPYDNLSRKEVWPELLELLEEIKDISSKINRINAVVFPGQTSKSENIFNYNHHCQCQPSNFLNVNEWPDILSCNRRQSQIDDNDISPSYTDTFNFNTITPTFYSCDRCLSNEHSHINCKRGSICLKCKQRGHWARQCKYNLCVHCQLYGHSRTNCPNLNRPPVCFKCGSITHAANKCDAMDPKYCRLCSGPHLMINCHFFNGECYRHFGDHAYAKCPLILARNNQRGRF